MKEKNYGTQISIPKEVDVNVNNSIVTIKGPKGTNERDFNYFGLKISYDNKKRVLNLSFDIATKREKKILNTIVAHIKNMISGVINGVSYQLKICSSHFPMNVSVKSNQFIVKNFLGEKLPRVLDLPNDVSVKINGNIIILEGINKEKVGTVASKIESLTKIKNRDRRIFQDGIYIINKNGKSLV